VLEVLDLGRDGSADENWNREPADRNEILDRCRSKRRGSAIRAMMVNAHSRKFLDVPCNRPRRHSFYSG
jgi:hypothetical protein